jgi:16S rRNA (guanine1207-N2)-methyltransferase
LSAGPTFCVYGEPPEALASVPAGALQVSPLVPGGAELEALEPGSLSGAVAAAPPGTLERRYTIACLLQALAPGAPLTVLAPKAKGGSRLRKDLEAFGCSVAETGRKHQRICQTRRPAAPTGLDAAIAAGAPRYSEALGLWTQPGVFSWDRPDPGTQALLAALPPLAGRGADFGCGLGVLARAVLASSGVTRLDLIDIDRRAIAAARRNVVDPRAAFDWADVRVAPQLSGLDFVVMNPPFHDGGREDRELGQDFVRQAHLVLGRGGVLWLVANRHLPYEAVLNASFVQVTPRGEGAGFKVYEARR